MSYNQRSSTNPPTEMNFDQPTDYHSSGYVGSDHTPKTNQTYADSRPPAVPQKDRKYVKNTQPVPTPAPLLQELVCTKNSIPNVVIFGETGTGKSSLVNMLSATEVASTSSGAVGETFSSKGYDVTIGETQYRFWDTAGLNEGSNGKVPAEIALGNLRGLVLGLQEGVNLLVYCIRAGRYREIIRVNYDLFHGIICQSKVPVVLVATGLENDSPMDTWWSDNAREFEQKYQLKFNGVACVTTIKGKKMKDGSFMFEDEYESSKGTVGALIKEKCPPEAWRLTSDDWVKQIDWRMKEYMHQFNQRTGDERKALDEDFEDEESGGNHASSSWWSVPKARWPKNPFSGSKAPVDQPSHSGYPVYSKPSSRRPDDGMYYHFSEDPNSHGGYQKQQGSRSGGGGY